jgi:hypothetical protein
MNVSYAVMAHPERAAWVAELQQTLGDVPVAWAEPPYATPQDRSAVWRTCREALLLHTDAPFHCVIQDDAVLAPRFTDRVEQMVEAGDYLYMLFWRPKLGYREEQHLAFRAFRRPGYFIKSGGAMLGVAMIYPTHLIPDIVAFCDAFDPTKSDDERVKGWADDRGISTYVPLPSPVNHRGDKSLVWHGGRKRVAWRFG